MARNVALLESCTLANALPGGCAWCGKALSGRRRKWCSEKCAQTFWKNHWWTMARRAARVRDKFRCRICGTARPKRPSPGIFTTTKAFKEAMRDWRAARKKIRLEVNHREPCRGQHGTISCAHHLDNLETLCAPCHKLHTAALPRNATAT